MASVPAPTNILPTGVDITTPATAAALTQTLANDGRTMLLIKNGNAGTINVTITAQQKVQDGAAVPLAVPSRTIAIATGKYFLIGPFPLGVYNDQNNEITVTIDVISSVLLQTLRMTAAQN